MILVEAQEKFGWAEFIKVSTIILLFRHDLQGPCGLISASSRGLPGSLLMSFEEVSLQEFTTKILNTTP